MLKQRTPCFDLAKELTNPFFLSHIFQDISKYFTGLKLFLDDLVPKLKGVMLVIGFLTWMHSQPITVWPQK